MPTLPYVTVDAFTSIRYAGNPLAIVLLPPAEAEQGAGAGAGTDLTAPAPPTLSTAQMQRIAQEFNYSETVFLHAASPSGESGATLQWRIRIFTTEAELPFAGHPTIGAAVYALSQQEGSTIKGQLLCAAGTIHISLSDNNPQVPPATASSLEDLLVHAEIPHNFHRHSEHPFTVPDVFALQPSLDATPLDPSAITIASPVKGMNFILIQLPDLQTLAKIALSAKPRPRLDREWDMGFVAMYFYVLLDDPSPKGEGATRVRTRMIEGGFEDPATGSAACALATHLALKAVETKAKGQGRRQRFEITQGVEMGRPGVIRVEVTLDEEERGLERLVLSGNAVRVMEGRVEY